MIPTSIDSFPFRLSPGNFNILLSLSPHQQNVDDYFEVLLSETINNTEYYINLHKDSRFSSVKFKYPPKPLKIKKKDDGEELVLPETEAEAIYRIEHSYYDIRKDMQMPMWRLHRNTILNLIEEINKGL